MSHKTPLATAQIGRISNICGIVYAQSYDDTPVNKKIWEQFDKQRSRGVQGFGFFDGKYTVKAAVEKRIKHKLLKSNKNKSSMILFHHRFPTSTINEKKAAHPFNTGDFFGDTRYVLVHNGVISNPKDLKKAHEKLGIEYQSVLKDGKFNDSEALLWDFALTMEGKQDDMEAYGGIAFICIKIVNGRPEKMFFGRNTGRPLMLKKDKTGILLSSEGEGEEIKTHTLYTYNYDSKRLSHKYFRVPSYDTSYDANRNWDTRYNRYQSAGTGTGGGSQNVCGYNPNAGTADDYDQEYYDDFGRYNPDKEVFYTDDGTAYMVVDGGLLYEDGTYEVWDDDKEKMVTVPFVQKDTKQLELIKDIMKRNSPLEPTQQDIETRIWNALIEAEGNYNNAYWAMERRFDDIDVTEPKGYELRKELRLLGRAIDEFTTRYSMFDMRAIHPWFVNKDKAAGKTGGVWVNRNLSLVGATA